MEAINAKISDLKQEQKALEEEKKALSQKSYKEPPPFEVVIAAFEQDPSAAMEKYRPIRDSVLQRKANQTRKGEIENRLHELFLENLEHQNTKHEIAKQNAAEQRIGEYEGLNENELKGKAVGLHARLKQYWRYSDPHDDNTDAETLAETKLGAVVILLKRKNVDVTYNQGTISFSGESRGKSCKIAKK